jgi:hypothetical protein
LGGGAVDPYPVEQHVTADPGPIARPGSGLFIDLKSGSVAQFLRLKSRDAARAIPNLNRLSVYKALGPLFCGFIIRAVPEVYSAADVAVLADHKSPVSVLLHRTAPVNLDRRYNSDRE